MHLTRSLCRIFVATAFVLMALPVSLALAWPEQPPDKATISGPGLKGEVEINDKAMLAALALGAIEDFGQGPIAAPQVGDGYTITRYFYGGTFNFARLHYYPNPAGRGYLYFEDGPQLSGDHTPYHQQWLYATPQGDATMQKLLNQLLPSPSASNAVFRPELLFEIGIALLSMLMLAGWRLVRRASRHTPLTTFGHKQSGQ